MNKQRAHQLYELADRLSKLDVNSLSEQQLEQRNTMIAKLQEEVQNLDEGWKDKLAAGALAGAMALGAGGAHARVSGDQGPGINRLTGKPIATQVAPSDQKPEAQASKGFSKEYLQSVVNGTHPRPMISVEKAKELLKQMPESVSEAEDGEYNDEAGMAKGSLQTMSRAVTGLMDTIQQGDNLPEWAQEKLSLAEDYLTTVWDYLLSQKEQGIEPKLESVDNGMPKDVKNKGSKLTAVNIKKTDAVSEEINTEAYERLQKVFAFKNYES